MKFKNIWLLLLMSVFAFQACEDDLTPRVDASEVKVTTHEIGIYEFEITNENSGLEAFKITWEEESDSINLDLKTTHVVQFDVVGNNFSQAKTFAQLENKSHSVIAKDLNKFLITNFAQEYNTAKEYEFRVVLAIIGKDNLIAPLPQSSVNSQTIKVTVIELKREPIYIVGDGLVGWNNDVANIGNNLQVLFADNNDSDMKYTYTSLFKPGGLKFITEAGEWNTAYGATSSATEEGTEIFNLELGKGDNVLTPGKEGIYTLTIERVESKLTAKLTSYKGEIKEYTTINLLGGSEEKDWEIPRPLIKVAEHVWVAKDVELKTGEYKFKGDGDWWGINKAELPFGIADGSNNMKITAGTYYVTFNDLTKHFVVIPMTDLPIKK